MAARLMVNAFDTGDFTGWKDPDDLGGIPTYSMSLSADGGMHSWSVMAEVVAESQCRYTLVVRYGDRGHFKFPVMKAILNETDPEHPRLIVTLYYGENLVLDCVNRPVYRPAPTPGPTEDEIEEDDAVEEDEVEDVDDGGLRNRFSGLGIGRRRTRVDDARYNRPPRSRMTLRRGGNGGSSL